MQQCYKKNGFVFLMIAGMSLGGISSAEALSNPFSALSSENIAEKILDTLQKRGPEGFCSRGDKEESVYSIRSFDGKAATASETLAALGMLACSENNADEFNKSKFYENAVKKLGTSDLGEIKTIFASKIKSAKGKVLSLSCKAVSAGLIVSGVGAVAAPAVSLACKLVK